MTFTAIRSALLHCLRDPGLAGDASAVNTCPMRSPCCKVIACMPWAPDALLPTLGPDVLVDDQRGRMLVPGFVDTMHCTRRWT